MKQYSKLEDLKKAIAESMYAYAERLISGDDMKQDGRAGVDWGELHLEEQTVSVGLMEWQYTIDIAIFGTRWRKDYNDDSWWYELDDISFGISISDIHCYTRSGFEVKASKVAKELERTLEIRRCISL